MTKNDKERTVTYVELAIDIDKQTHAELLKLAREHILKDEKTLLSWAVTKILSEQISKEKDDA